MASPLASVARDLCARGYSFVPVMPAGKAPGTFWNGWRPMTGWTKFAEQLPDEQHISRWETWPEANVGVLLGSLRASSPSISTTTKSYGHRFSNSSTNRLS